MEINNTAPTRKVIRGDTDSFTVKFNNVHKNNLGIKVKEPIDITDWVVSLTVRATIPETDIISDVDAVIPKTADIPVGTDGVAYFNITSQDTNIDEGTYWYDIQYIINENQPNEVVKSLYKGKYIIISDITRAT